MYAGVVKGVIRDTTGQPIPYVAVVVKNSTYGVNSNLNGAYFLELKPGRYTLVFSQLGLQTQEHSVSITDEKPVILNITMNTESRMLSQVVIKATGDRDMGKEIMKKVIDHRSEYWDKVQNYKCNTYQKSSLEKILIEKPGADTIPVKPKEEPKDTTKRKGKGKDELEEVIKNKQLNLIESVSETYFKRPNTFKENIFAYHDFAEKKRPNNGGTSRGFDYGEHEIAPVQYYSENPYLLISDAQSIDFNFYKNQIEAPALCSRPLLSPAAATAFVSYRFDLLSTFVSDGKKIHKIGVNPLFREDALFNGVMFIEDSSWAIISVNLNINPGVLLYCKDFSVIQDYSEVQAGIYLPVRREFIYTIREGKYNIIGNMRVDHSNYEVNIAIPEKLFNDEVKHYAVDAFDKDSAYWSEKRTIQLDEKELKYIHTVDSLAAYYESEKYLASLDSSFNKITFWSFVLYGVGHRNRARGNEFYFEPLVAQIVPFGVGGYRHRLGGYYNHDFTNGMTLETNGQIDYGFMNKDVRGKVGAGLTYLPKRFVRTYVRFGDFYDMINNFSSLTTIFSRSNWVRCKEFSVAQRMEITNGLFGELTLEYSDQIPLTGMQLEQWSTELFDTLNTPTAFQRYTKTEVRLEVKYRFRQKYIIKKNRKIILGSKYPEIRFLYRKGIPDLFNSEVNFDYIEFSSIDEMKFGRFGTSSWNVLAGAFINKKNLRILEHKYFRGSDSFIFTDPLRSFQLLGPRLSTADYFLRINYIHHFEGAFGSKVPLFNKLKITSAVGGGVLMIPAVGFYHQEFFVGLERIIRIKKQLFRIGAFAVTADNTLSKAAITYKVGISFYNSFTRKWSY
ncbi:MAG: DUF5686 and carboxypeptidase regulatory-like domain-containing protein [Bacteroidia bacterium]